MATAPKHSQYKNTIHPDTAASPQPKSPVKPPRKRRGRRWLLPVGLLLLVLIWFAPAIIAHSFLLNWIIDRAAADLQGTVRVESASLGWLSPATVANLEIVDRQNQRLLQVAELSTDKSLLGFLLNATDLGKIQLDRPKLSVVSRLDGSNVEDVLAKYLVPTEGPPWKGSLTLKIVDGEISILDQTSRQSARLANLGLSLDMTGGTGGPMRLEVQSAIADPQTPGGIAVAWSAGDSASQNQLSGMDAVSELKIELVELPLEPLESLLNRFGANVRISGRLSSRINLHPSVGSAKPWIEGELSVDELSLAGAALGDERLMIHHANAACRASQSPGRIDIAQSLLECDLGSAAFSGSLALEKNSNNWMLDSVLRRSFQLEANLNLARLANMLPNTMRIRKDTQITSGQLSLAISGEGADPATSAQPGSSNAYSPDMNSAPAAKSDRMTRWKGRVEAGGLRAVAQGRQLAWDRPILIELDAHDGPQGPEIDNLQCESDFLKIQAAGTLESLFAKTTFNLRQLADQLSRFVDLGAVQLAGEGSGRFTWKHTPRQEFELSSSLQVRDFQLTAAGMKPWKEQDLTLEIDADGQIALPTTSDAVYSIFAPSSSTNADRKVATSLKQAELNLRSGTDAARVQLLQPVSDLNQNAWPLSIALAGQLETWAARLGIWMPLPDWQLSGSYRLDVAQANLTLPQFDASKAKLELRQAKLSAEQLRAVSPWLNINEPVVEMNLAGDWDQAQRKLRLETATFSSSAVGLRCDNCVLALPAKAPPELAGTLAWRGDLGRLQQWFTPGGPSALRMDGQIDGSAALEPAAGRIAGRLEAAAANVTISNSSGERFQQPQVNLACQGQYDLNTGIIQLAQLQLQSSVIAGNLSGQIGPPPSPSPADNKPATPKGETNLDLSGQVTYDLDKVMVLLRPYVGTNVRLSGRNTSAAVYHGPLDPGRASASAALKWDSANIYGFALGPAEVKTRLANGILNLDNPLELAVSQGSVVLAPTVRFSPGPAELTLPAGPLVRRVQLSPEMCSYALQYAAPILAGVTEARGAFSVNLQNCRIPLSDPAQSEISGQLVIHSVEISPGPLIRVFAILLGRETPATLRRESVVPFHMTGGRVYHEQLELIFPELTIRTKGSVGLDQRIEMVAEMPVPPKWLANTPVGSALRNMNISIPLRGTLNKPELDGRVIDQLSRQFIQNAAKNVIEDSLQNLDRLFGPQK
jgi:translocation and assembly module TamB